VFKPIVALADLLGEPLAQAQQLASKIAHLVYTEAVFGERLIAALEPASSTKKTTIRAAALASRTKAANGRFSLCSMASKGTLRVATNCFFTALNWTTGKLTVVGARLVSVLDGGNCVDQFSRSTAARGCYA
jgi:hypothetical protein